MDPEDRKLLQETHDMVKKMRGAQKNARMWKAIYWVVGIGLTIAAYAYIKPYLQRATDAYDQAQAQLQGIKDLGNGFGGGQ